MLMSRIHRTIIVNEDELGQLRLQERTIQMSLDRDINTVSRRNGDSVVTHYDSQHYYFDSVTLRISASGA